MAGVLSECGGIRLMLSRLAAVHDLVAGKQLMTVLLKLFSYCVKVKANRQALIKPEINSISIMLGALNLVRMGCYCSISLFVSDCSGICSFIV